ncbi:hypothetical protein, partial [Erythrobacter sp. YJ-T3-07]|uniref:hypothetical protein n=1 Tax=Erythrobacter sp. YJ-T3-07 TaxID=2793063 RepID=UPI001F18C7E4
MGVTQFQWIHSSDGQEYTSEKRRAIRVQAMRAIAAERKQSVTWGKVNKLQAPQARHSETNEEGD